MPSIREKRKQEKRHTGLKAKFQAVLEPKEETPTRSAKVTKKEVKEVVPSSPKKNFLTELRGIRDRTQQTTSVYGSVGYALDLVKQLCDVLIQTLTDQSKMIISLNSRIEELEKDKDK